MEFQASLSYRLRPCLKKKKSKNRNGIPGSYGNFVSFLFLSVFFSLNFQSDF